MKVVQVEQTMEDQPTQGQYSARDKSLTGVHTND